MLDAVVFNEAGLIPAIAQDVDSKEILMVAWMNREALQETVDSKRAVYFSRSRQQIWRKGEESGHMQLVKEIRLDCDGDVILMQVEQMGGIACHTGRAHCFYQKLDQDDQWQDSEPVIKPASKIYPNKDK